jgi:ribosome-binding factor A
LRTKDAPPRPITDPNAMENKRQKQFARQIQKDLGEIFQREAQPLFGNMFVTVTHVLVTPDLSLAKVYLSFLMTPSPQAALQLVDEHKGQLRMLLGARLRHQVRKIPDLAFFLDNTQDEMDRVERLFKDIDIPPADEA